VYKILGESHTVFKTSEKFLNGIAFFHTPCIHTQQKYIRSAGLSPST